MDGTYDYLGEPRLVDHAATRIKHRPAASSNSDKVARSSRGGMAQKWKCEVVIPPVRSSRRQTTKLRGQVIDLCSDDEQSTEESSLSDSNEYRPAANDLDGVKMDVDEGLATLPQAGDNSSSEELTLLSHTKKRKASLPQPSRPALSKRVKGLASSQPVASLKGKEPARAPQIKDRHVVISSPVAVSLDEQHPPTPLPSKGPETLFDDDNALKDTRNEAVNAAQRDEAHGDAHDDTRREPPEESTGDTLNDVRRSNPSHSEPATALTNSDLSIELPLLPPAPVNVPTPISVSAPVDAPALVSMPTSVNVPAPVNTPAPVNMPATVNTPVPVDEFVKPPLNAPPRGGLPPEPDCRVRPRPRVVQRGEVLDGDDDPFSLRKRTWANRTMLIANEAPSQGASPAASRLASAEEGQVISAATVKLTAAEEGRGSISTASQEVPVGSEATNEVPYPSQPLHPLEAATSYDAHAYTRHSENLPHGLTPQFQDNTYLPDRYAAMGFNNVGWYNPRSPAENRRGPYVPMYAPPAPPPPYRDPYHPDVQRYGPNPPHTLQYREMPVGPGYYYPGQEGPYRGYHESAPYHPHPQPPLLGSTQTGRNTIPEQNHGESSSQQRSPLSK